MNPATSERFANVGAKFAPVGHMEHSDIPMESGESKRGQDLLQYAIEALQHAVQWGGIAHLRADKAKALLDELARLREREARR